MPRATLESRHRPCRLDDFLTKVLGNFATSFAEVEVCAAIGELLSMGHLDRIYTNDVRIGQLVRNISSILPSGKPLWGTRGRLPRRRSGSGERLLPLLESLHQQLMEIAEMTLEDELASIAATVGSDRNRDIVIQRYGFDGSGGCSFDEVGERYFVTRQRAQQICAKFSKGLQNSYSAFTPALDRVLALIASQIPAPAETVEATMVSRGLTRSAFALSGVTNALSLLGREASFLLSENLGSRFVLPLTSPDLPERIASAAKRAVGRWGCTTVAELQAELRDTVEYPVSLEAVERVLKRWREAAWLDSSKGWFWVPSVRNRLLNQITKVMAVSGRIPVSELRTAVSRHYRMQGFAPPRRVLLELCRQSGYLVEHDVVVQSGEVPIGNVLGPMELTMVEVLRENGPLLPRPQFEDLCLERGMNRMTFYTYLDNSPVIARYAKGVYGLPGAPIAPGQAEALKPGRRGGWRVLKDFGWTEDGQVCLIYCLSEAMLLNGVFSVPSSLREVIVGEFTLKAADDAVIGTLTSKETGSWGLTPLFSRRGGDAGDHLLLKFDLVDKVALAYLGDDLLVETFHQATGTAG